MLLHCWMFSKTKLVGVACLPSLSNFIQSCLINFKGHQEFKHNNFFHTGDTVSLVYQPINPLTNSIITPQHHVPCCVAAIKKISFPGVRDLSETPAVLCGVMSRGIPSLRRWVIGKINPGQWVEMCGVHPLPWPKWFQTLRKIPGVIPAILIERWCFSKDIVIGWEMRCWEEWILGI